MFPLYDTIRSRTFPLINLTLVLANVLAFLIAVTNSYVMNFLITFAGGMLAGRYGSFRVATVCSETKSSSAI